ncbi:MAG: glycosyltransferase [Alphaproteobacteria bacterium]|nr:glycosyltransferase [Alphaproteobacteria bacterium]
MTARLNVLVLAPMFDGADSKWLDDFVCSELYAIEKAYRRRKQRSWHQRGARTPLAEWIEFLDYARRAFARKPDIIVTVFPAVAFAVAVWKRVLFRRTPIIAWAFNIGSTASALKGRLAGIVLRGVDLFVVHSREERQHYARWLDLPVERFRFVPLQRGGRKFQRKEETSQPYMLAMGSAGRDYQTLIDATRDLGARVVIVAKQDVLRPLKPHSDVEFCSNLSMSKCEELLSAARLNVVPISNVDTASGQVTFLMSLCYGVPTVATDCPGTRDYLTNGHDALLVPAGDAGALRSAIKWLWTNESERARIGQNGLRTWKERFSDPPAAAALEETLEFVRSRTAGARV